MPALRFGISCASLLAGHSPTRAAQSSLVIALYTVNTSHFHMEPHLFLGIMASHGFEPDEFKRRDPSVPLPPPFGAGPPLGQGLAAEAPVAASERQAAPSAGPSEARSATAGQQAARRGGADGGGARPGAGLSKAQKAQLGRIEAAGAEAVRARGLPAGLAREYPYMLVEPDALFLKDVRHLLEEYRRVVLQYESLKAGVASEGLR
jgi:hypothetical protein